jgi:hypothetical protein
MIAVWILLASVVCAPFALAWFAAWLVRRFFRRRHLLKCFGYAVREGHVFASLDRYRNRWDDGYRDVLIGTAGTMRFRLVAAVSPLDRRRDYALGIVVKREGSTGRQTVERFVVKRRKPDDLRHPLARAYKDIITRRVSWFNRRKAS